MLVAIVTVTLSPMLFNWLMPQREPRERVIVVGARAEAAPLAQRLHDHGLDVVLVCGDPDQESQLQQADIPVICSQPTLAEALRLAGIHKASTVLAMETDDEDNLRICRLAREIYGIENVVASVQDPAQNSRFRRLGVRLVNPAYSTMLMLVSLALSPGVYSITPDVDETQKVREVKVQNADLDGKRLSDLELPAGVMVLTIQRGGDLLTPSRDTALRANDTITVAGLESGVDRAVRYLARSRR